VKRAWEGLLWYLREVTGESQYDRYLERHARQHAEMAPMSRREFERRRTALMDAKPGSRCC
jgi:uncharacterized short protein YbdD (DUF466 family)